MKLVLARGETFLLVYLILFALVTTLATGVVSPVRAVGGILLVFALPGFALLRASTGSRRMEGLRETLLVPLLSIASTILCGLALDLLSHGLTQSHMARALGTLALLGSLVSFLRGTRRLPQTFPPRSMLRIALLLPAAVLAVFALVLARHDAKVVARTDARTVLFVQQGTGKRLLLSVRSEERSPVNYTLELTSRRGLVGSWTSALSQGEERQFSVALPKRFRGRLRAVLFRGDMALVAFRTAAIVLR